MMQNRGETWENFLNSIWAAYDRERDNSYMVLEEEPSNVHDPNAIRVVCCGECSGTMGYVGKEYTANVKGILGKCKLYRLDLIDEAEVGQREVRLQLTWKP